MTCENVRGGFVRAGERRPALSVDWVSRGGAGAIAEGLKELWKTGENGTKLSSARAKKKRQRGT